jgi:hypothetical protein
LRRDTDPDAYTHTHGDSNAGTHAEAHSNTQSPADATTSPDAALVVQVISDWLAQMLR